ncbi:MAG: archaeosortase/exosortase family protein [Cyanobacteriota bacterium]|nr:archaeosortase/exosortase family protein [Cyanobacteriota bacterium]
MFLVLVWAGAYLVLEEPFPWRPPHPSRFGAWLGFSLVLWVLWRSHLIFSLEAGASFLPFIVGVALTLMAVPLRGFKSFFPSLFVLALLPVTRGLLAILPMKNLIMVNAQLVKILLVIGGIPVRQSADTVTIPGGSIQILEACTGMSTLLQLLLVAIIFALAFPMRFRWQNVSMAFVALAFGLLVNGFRLVLLTLIVANGGPGKQWWFELFHTGWPSLLFPGIAMLLFLQVYILWMERQVAQLEQQ